MKCIKCENECESMYLIVCNDCCDWKDETIIADLEKKEREEIINLICYGIMQIMKQEIKST